jgi:hypothetical protein
VGQRVKARALSETEHRSRILREVADALVDRFGEDMFIRIGPSLQAWRHSLVLEAFAPNTSSAPASLEIDEAQAYLEVGDAVDCVFFENHLLDDDVSRWATERITAAGERGLEMWVDPRHHIFGGQNQARIVGEDFLEVTPKRRGRLRLNITTEPWGPPSATQLADPIPRIARKGTAFLVDSALPEALQQIALSARQEFRDRISIVTRMDVLGGTRILEVLPTNPEASPMRIKQLGPDSIGTSTGDSQYFEYEFTPIQRDAAEQWVLNVGRLGLLESTVWRGSGYRFVNAPATPEAIVAAESNPRVRDISVWHPWRW